MTTSDVYKALAERMLVAADDAPNPERREELLRKADAAIQRAQELREREQMLAVPQMLGSQMRDVLQSMQMIADTVVRRSKAALAGAAENRGSSRVDEVQRESEGLQALSDVAEGADSDIRKLHKTLMGILEVTPGARDGGALGDSVTVLAAASDCLHRINVAIEKLDQLGERLEAAAEEARRAPLAAARE